MVVMGAKLIRAVTFHSIRTSVIRRLSPSGRWRERRPALSRFDSPPPSIQFVPLRVSSDAPHAVSL
jgi:hypothetical protein